VPQAAFVGPPAPSVHPASGGPDGLRRRFGLVLTGQRVVEPTATAQRYDRHHPASGNAGRHHDGGAPLSSDDFILGFRRLSGELDQLFVELCGGPRSGRGEAVRALADVYLTEDPPTLTVQLDLAGVEPDGLDISLSGDVLTVRGTRARPRGERRVYQHAEIDWGPFERRLRLGVAVQADAARASYERGLLTIAMPLAPSRPGGRVSVRVKAG
jgi:HSP20 family protein